MLNHQQNGPRKIRIFQAWRCDQKLSLK